MSYFDFKDWYQDIKEKDHEYIKNLKHYGFRIVFDKTSVFFNNKNIYPSYPWEKNYKKIWFREKNIYFEKWLFNKNKKLYLDYQKTKKKQTI